MPAYLGADTQQLSAGFDFHANYGDQFFASFADGVGVNLINEAGWRAGPIAKYDIGRLENGDNPLFIGGSKTSDLKGLGDIEGAAELGGFIEYTYESVKGKIEARKASRGHDGTVAEATFTYNTSIELCGKTALLEFGTEFIYGNKNYNMAYFGITPSQAKASGLSEYTADSGWVSQGLGFSVAVPVEQHVTVIGFVKYSRLAGDAEHSSLIVERGSPNQLFTALLMNYSF